MKRFKGGLVAAGRSMLPDLEDRLAWTRIRNGRLYLEEGPSGLFSADLGLT
jgi:hypothetical protein